MPGNIAGPLAAVPGQAGWTWYTGSAAWYLRVLMEGVLGVEAQVQGLRVRASLPDSWDRFRIKRLFRGAIYDITVQRAASGEQPEWYVNGTCWQSEFLPPAAPDTIQIVNIMI
jgi:cellobiose phosphorylase